MDEGENRKDVKTVAQFYENNGQLRQYHAVNHLLGEGIQTQINAVSLRMFGDGETLERSLECLRNAEK